MDERRQAIIESTADSADMLKRFIKACRDEGMSWEEIGVVCQLPAYCVRVIAGEIRKNRPTPDRQSGR